MSIVITTISYTVRHLFVVFHYNLAVEAVNQCIQHAHTSRFRTSDVLTAKIMAAKKGCGAAALRLNN